MKQYSVRQFCDMVGVPYSSLRYYERIGLLKPKQDRLNNYRSYTVNDAFLLNRFKNYRAIGFEVKEALEIINKDCNRDLAQKIDRLEEELYTQMKLLQEQLKRIEKLKSDFKWLESNTTYRIGEMEDKWFLPASEGFDFTVAKFDVFSKWVELLPTTAYCKRIKHQEDLKKDYGISINVSDAHLLEPELLQNAELINGGKGLMFISHQLKGESCLEKGFKEAFAYMKQEGFIQNGDIYLEGTMFKSESGIRPDVVFIPIL